MKSAENWWVIWSKCFTIWADKSTYGSHTKIANTFKIVKFVKIMHFIPRLHCAWLYIITEPHPKSKNKAIAKAFDSAFYAVSSRL